MAKDTDYTELAKALAKEIGLELGAQLGAQAMLNQRPAAGEAPRALMGNQAPRGEMCRECGQPVTACSKKHEQIVVFPTKYPEFAKFFTGYGINGIWYRSPNANTPVTVPANAAQAILAGVQTMEKVEHETRQGHVKEHNSGSADRPRSVEYDGTSFR